MIMFSNRWGIILLIYTLVDQNDSGSFLRRWIHQPQNTDHTMIYPHRKRNSI